jgi:mono/diheme cytochrome c family protein
MRSLSLATGTLTLGLLVAGLAVADEPAADEGAKTYASYCVACHGAQGKGDGAVSASLDPKPADFSSEAFWKGKDAAAIKKVISEGGAAVGKSPLMAAFGKVLSPTQLDAVVKHVEGFRPTK